MISVATTPTLATRVLRAMTVLDGHQFWMDDLRHVTGDEFAIDVVTGHRDVTDAHLVALARRNGGRLVTFDERITRHLAGDETGLVDVPGGAEPG